MSKYLLTQEDLDAGPDAVNAKLTGAFGELSKHAQGAAAQARRSAEVTEILNKYEIFGDEQLGEVAEFQAAQALEALPDGAGRAAADAAVKAVAQKWSATAAAMNPSPDTAKPPAPGGGGGAAAAHVDAGSRYTEPPKDMAEARARVKEIGDRKAKELGLR